METTEPSFFRLTSPVVPGDSKRLGEVESLVGGAEGLRAASRQTRVSRTLGSRRIRDAEGKRKDARTLAGESDSELDVMCGLECLTVRGLEWEAPGRPRAWPELCWDA